MKYSVILSYDEDTDSMSAMLGTDSMEEVKISRDLMTQVIISGFGSIIEKLYDEYHEKDDSRQEYYENVLYDFEDLLNNSWSKKTTIESLKFAIPHLSNEDKEKMIEYIRSLGGDEDEGDTEA